jgi:O-antigen/teichoic acid export membrane protein
MRFKRLAAGQFMPGALGPASQVALALAHCGSYALVLPRLIVGVAKWWFFRSAAPVRVRRDPQFRLWKYILAPGVLVLVTNLAYNIGPSVPILMLGHVGGAGSQMGKEFAGVFGFAYNLSLQSIMLLGMQIDSILFPTLGRMAGDPVRQRGALLRAGHALAAVMAPVCLFQIVAARPIILLVFGAKWEFAVVPFQIMSVGMLFAGAFAPAQSLLQAQVRFGKKLFIAVLWNVISGIVSAAGILWAPPEHAVDAAAVGLAVGYIGYGIHNCISATRPIGGNALDVLRILAMPCVVGLLAAGIAMGADYYATPAATGMLEHLAAWGVTHWPRTIDPAHADELRARVRDMLVHMFRISVLGGAGGVSFLALLRTLAPGVWEDMMSAAGPIIRRVRRALPRPLRGKAE